MSRSASCLSHRSGKKIPLRIALVIPFVLPVATVVGAMGYLSVRNGQQTITNLANQLATKTDEQIEQRLTSWLRVPAAMSRSDAAAIRLGMLDWRSPPALKRYFGQQLQIFDSVDTVAVIDEQRRVLALEKHHDGSVDTHVENEVTLYSPAPALIRNDSAPLSRLIDRAITTSRDLRHEDWYLAAKTTGKPQWQLITSLDRNHEPVLQAVNFQPFYDRTNLFRGVLAASAKLTQLGSFLKDLKIGSTGQVFIAEQSGLLVATTDDKPIFRRRSAVLETSKSITTIPQQLEPQRIKAVNSHNVVIQQVATFLTDRFGGFDHIYTQHHLSLTVDQQRYFVSVKPLASDRSLNWLVVVILPEADFTDVVQGNHRLTLLLCAGALTVATILGWLTASRIAGPILRLSYASRELALGEWPHPVESQSRIAELEVLAHSFNQMSEHLQQSFDQVKTALQESEARFTKVFRTSPDAISIATLPERRYIEVNDQFLAFTGYSREEVIGQSAVSLSLVVSPTQVARFEQLVRSQNYVRDAEIDYRNKHGQLRTVLVSAEVVDLDGQSCLLCIYREITARKQAEEALRQSEQRFRNAFDTTAVGMALTAPDGRFLQVNPSLCQMLGYTEAELLKRTFSEITHPDDLETTLGCALKLLAGEISYYHLEKRYQHRDGQIIWCLLSVSLVRDSQQQPLYFVAQMQDITTQKAALDKRRQAEVAI